MRKSRSHPPQGVLIFRGVPTIVFLTVFTRNRRKCLANHRVNEAFKTSWQMADSWSVGEYVVMPDHVHLFCVPHDEDFTVRAWVTYWKRQMTRLLGNDAPNLQELSFHHRLRREENYREKWDYIRANPVRAGLVKEPDEWPFFGTLNELRW